MVLIFIRFVRREKEIAEARFEVAQVETQRYQQRMEHLEKELKEVQDSLTAERDKLQVKSHKMRRWYSDVIVYGTNCFILHILICTDDYEGHGSAGGKTEKAGELECFDWDQQDAEGGEEPAGTRAAAESGQGKDIHFIKFFIPFIEYLFFNSYKPLCCIRYIPKAHKKH